MNTLIETTHTKPAKAFTAPEGFKVFVMSGKPVDLTAPQQRFIRRDSTSRDLNGPSVYQAILETLPELVARAVQSNPADFVAAYP